MSYVTDSFDDEVTRLLMRGGVGLLPTDTIYGLSCRALDAAAVGKIHKLKDRSAHKPFIILISDIKMLDLLAPPQNLSGAVGNRIAKRQVFGAGLSKESIEKYWPGAITLIFEMPSALEYLARGTGSLAVRLPNYPELLDLINKTGPLISTSANLEGEQPVQSVPAAQRLFGDKLDFYVNAGNLDNPPSTLAVIKDGKLEVVRQGAVKIDKDKEEL